MPWGNMGTIWSEVGLDNRKLVDGMKESNRLIEDFDRNTSRRFKAIGDSFSKVGRDLSLKVTAPLALIGGVSAKMSAEFETSMTNVWTLMDVGADSMANMSREVEELSRRIPQTATQLADGLYQVVSAGVDAENSMYVLETAAKAASAGLSDTYTSVDAITTILNAYGMEATQAGHVSDLLFKTLERGKTTFGELAGNIGQVVSTAATADVSIEELMASLSALTKVGVSTAEATTAMNQTILTFIRPTDDAKAKARELGFELSATALQSEGFIGMMNQMYEATGGNVEALAELFPNIRALKGVLGLSREEMELYTSDLEAMTSATGAMETAFTKQIESSKNQAQLFKNELSMLARGFGDELWPELIKGMDILKPMLKTFTDLPTPVKQSAVQFGLFAAAIGPVLMLVGKLTVLLSGPAGLVLAVSAAVFGITGLVRASKDLEGQIDRQVRAAREAIDSALENARAYKNQGDEIDRLIEEYHKLKAEAGDNYTEHEGLRQVIDKIVQLCPEAATGYDDMSRALMDNADGAKRYRDELYKLHEYELKIAASRAKYELPELKRQAEWLKPDIERTRKQLDELSPLYEKASRFWYKLQELNREEDIAIDKRDVAAQEAIAKQRELLQQEAVNAGIIATTMDPLGAQIYEIRKQYEKTLDIYTDLLSTQQTTIKGIIELQGKQEELEEFRAGGQPEEDPAEQALLEAAKNKIKAMGELSKASDDQLSAWKKDLQELLNEARSLGEAGQEAAVEYAKAIDLINSEIKKRAGGDGDLDEFEELGNRIKRLSDETHGVLRESWEKIEEGLKSDDIVERIYAEDQLGKLTRYLKDKIFEFGGDFEQAASAAAQYIEDGWKEITAAGMLREEMDVFRARVAIEGLGVDEQIAEFERLRDVYADTGADITQIDVQLAGLREQKRQEEVRSETELYRHLAQLYNYNAQNHIDHIERILDSTELSADEQKDLEQELQLWKKRRREEELHEEERRFQYLNRMGALTAEQQLSQVQTWLEAETEGSERWQNLKLEEKRLLDEIETERINKERARFELMRTLGLATLEEQLEYELQLVEAATDGTAEKSQSAQEYYRFLMSLIRDATEEELASIRETLEAQLAKYEAMGEGATEAALAIQAVLAEIDEVMGKMATNVERAWGIGLGNIESMISGMASSLRELDDGWSSFFATILENIQFVKVEGEEMIDWAETLAATMAGMEMAGFTGIGRSLGAVVSGEAGAGDWGGLAGAGIGAAIGGPVGAAIGHTLGELIGGLFEGYDKPSSSIQTRVGNLAKELEEYAKGGEKYYKNWWNKLWGKSSRDLEKTFQDITKILGTTIDDIASSLASAFQAETYEDFVDGFSKNIEQQTMQALITAFMASDVMKPLLDNLSRTITKAAMDAELTDEEKAAIRSQISDIVDAAEPFYDMLQEMFPEFYEPAGRGADVSRRGTMISEITGPTRDLLIETMRPLTVLDSMPVYFSSMERAIYEMRDAFLEYATLAGVEVSGEMGFSQAIYEMRDALLEYTRTEAAITHKRALVMYEYHIQQVNVYPPRDATLWDILRTLQKKSDYAVIGSGAAKIGGAYTGGVI